MIELTENESVRRGGESYSIGDKVFGSDNAGFGVGYITAIRLYGVHFGFSAKITDTINDNAVWVDSRNLSKELPEWVQQYENQENDVVAERPNNNDVIAE